MSKRLALIIGNSLYRDEKLARLISPDADVGALKDILFDPEMGGFDDVNLVFNSASHIVRREISNFFARKARTDLLLLYFSGHGVLDDRGRLYLAVKDTDTKLLRGTAIPASYITDEMDNSRSQRQVLVLDCCHSGAFARGTKGSVGASVGTASAFEGSGFGRVVLTASDATQYAWEGNQIIGEAENSLFTHFIIQGIRSGEADINRDGSISIDEIYDYAYGQILKQTPKQTPGKWSFKEQGELIIARAPFSESPVEPLVPGSPEGSYVDEDELQFLQKLYMDGLSAYWLEDWGTVVNKFEAILEKAPDYPDILEKLEEARQLKNHADLYSQAIIKHEEGELGKSIKLLESLIAEAPDYQDAAQRLEKLKFEKELEDLYSQAQNLFESGKYQAVVRVIENLHTKSPGFIDRDGLLEKAKNEVEVETRNQQLEDLYNRGLLELDAGRVYDAKLIFMQIQVLEEGYRDTEKLLERVNALISEDQHLQAEAAAREKEDKKTESRPVAETRQAMAAEQDFKLPPLPDKTYREEKQTLPRTQQPRKALNVLKWFGIGIVAIVVLIGGIQLISDGLGGSSQQYYDEPEFAAEEPVEEPIAEEPALSGDIVLWHSLTDEELEGLDEVISNFLNEYPGVTIDLNSFSYAGELYETFYTEAEAGAGPDLFIGYIQDAAMLYDASLISDVSDLELGDIRQYETVTGFRHFEGIQVGIPLSISGVVMFRNQSIIADPATDFADLKAKAEAATTGATYGAILDTGMFFSLGHLYALGGELMTPVGDPAFNTPEGVAWLEMLFDFQALGAETSYSTLDNELFKNGDVGVIIDTTYTINEYYEWQPGDIVIDPWPRDMSGLVLIHMIYLNANSSGENRNAAKVFMQYLFSAEAQTTLYEWNKNFIPSNRAVEVTDPLRQQAIEALEGGIVGMNIPETDVYWVNLQEYITYMLEGGWSPEETLSIAEETIKEEIKDNFGH